MKQKYSFVFFHFSKIIFNNFLTIFLPKTFHFFLTVIFFGCNVFGRVGSFLQWFLDSSSQRVGFAFHWKNEIVFDLPLLTTFLSTLSKILNVFTTITIFYLDIIYQPCMAEFSQTISKNHISNPRQHFRS